MAAVAKNPAFAKKVGIKQSVGEEFMKADKGRKFKEGGAMDLAQDKKMVKKAVGMHDKQLHGGKKTNLTKLAKGGYCGGGKMKAKRYNGETSSVVRGGNVPDTTREETREAFKKRQEAKAELEQIKKDKIANKVYADKAAQYQRELELDPPDTNPVGYNIRKFEDKVGDKIRSVGKFFGSNRMTSQDDEAQMKARQDIKGYKKGGSVRGCGIAQRGKTKGRMV